MSILTRAKPFSSSMRPLPKQMSAVTSGCVFLSQFWTLLNVLLRLLRAGDCGEVKYSGLSSLTLVSLSMCSRVGAYPQVRNSSTAIWIAALGAPSFKGTLITDDRKYSETGFLKWTLDVSNLIMMRSASSMRSLARVPGANPAITKLLSWNSEMPPPTPPPPPPPTPSPPARTA